MLEIVPRKRGGESSDASADSKNKAPASKSLEIVETNETIPPADDDQNVAE